MLSFLLPLALMQVGPAPTTAPISPVPPELRDRPARNGVRTAPMLDRAESRPAIEQCLDTARTDPARARDFAAEWVGRTDGLQRAAGRHCLGVAAGNIGDWDAAAAAFVAARDEAGGEVRFKARMGALAGSAYLASASYDDALAALTTAHADAAGDAALTGAIDLDKATALVALGRLEEAKAALADARVAVPEDAHAWLLSATLARRMENLPAAQAHIERADQIDPRDPAIGLEAGVLAALGGRDEAARKSFESVIAASADGPLAERARTYLEQLGR